MRKFTSNLPAVLTMTIILFAQHFVSAQDSTKVHPRLFFNRAGMEALRTRVLEDPLLSQIWQKFKLERVDKSYEIKVSSGGSLTIDGRNYGDAICDMTFAYIVLQDSIYVDKAIEIMTDLAEKNDWGQPLVVGHVDIGFALAWDVMYDLFSDNQRNLFRDAILTKADTDIPNDVYANVNWTPAAGLGLVGLAFQGDGDNTFNGFVKGLLDKSKRDYKEGTRNVLWAHGSDGFPHEGLGYWRKYIHVGLFFKALRRAEPQNDWFHLGSEYPGSEFLEKTAYPRIYGDVQHKDLACLTWSDSRQVEKRSEGQYGNLGLLTLIASEYQDGYVYDFINYLVNDVTTRFNEEDWSIFLFYDKTNIPLKSYRDLPLSRYWPDMEAAIFRSGWDKHDLVFYMRCGSPGGHGRGLKLLSPGAHDHPDANGFTLFYDNDYLAAEDGAYPVVGPDKGNEKITYGHNTFLIDGQGQRGDRTVKVSTTDANMDYLDAEHVSYLLGDGTDAYAGLDRFYRYVIYKKHKYLVIVDELSDATAHKYEFLLGTDDNHFITSLGENKFSIDPDKGSARLPVVFVEPKEIESSVNQERPYAIEKTLVEMLRVWPKIDAPEATFFTLLYPIQENDPEPVYTKIYDGGRSGILVGEDEYYLYNKSAALYSFGNISTDAKLCYFKDSYYENEYLTAGSKEFIYKNIFGIRSDRPLVAAFKQTSGTIRVGKNLGEDAETIITLYYPGITDLLIDGQMPGYLDKGPGWIKIRLGPKQYKIGPSNARQTVTDNYRVEILAQKPLEVISPNGGEVWESGTSQTIRWTSDNFFSEIKIEYSTDAGTTWKLIADSTENDGSFGWTVPVDPTDRALVRISNVDGGLPFDISDANFAIFRPLIPPVIGSFVPLSGPVGTTVSIAGEGLSKVTNVTFNDVSADEITIDSDSLLYATVPSGATTGKITVTNELATVTSAVDFVVKLPPEISFFLPKSGTVGDEVQILGARFEDIIAIEFNNAKVDSFVTAADTLIRTWVPATASTGKIKVASKNGEATSNDVFRVLLPPEISSFIPLRGPVGARVKVFGKHFLGTTSVAFADEPAAAFTVHSDTLITVKVPDAAVTGKIFITNAVGSAFSHDPFSVQDIAQVISFVPAGGPVGTTVRVVGVNLSGATDVAFNGVLAGSFSVESDTLLRVIVPSQATTGQISVTKNGVTVTSQSEFVVYTPTHDLIFRPSDDAYVNVQKPTNNYGDNDGLKIEAASFRSFLKFNIAGLSHAIKSATLRLYVTNESVKGGQIFSVSNVYRDSSVAWSESGLLLDNAPDIVGQPLDSLGVVVAGTWVEFNVAAAITADGQYSFGIDTSDPDKVEYNSKEGLFPPELIVETLSEAPPVIISFSPMSGSPGTMITLKGSGFLGVTEVSFNTASAQLFEAISDSVLHAFVPETASTGPISMVNSGGVSSTLNVFTVIKENQDTVFVFQPVEDSYISSLKATKSYGDANELFVSSSNLFKMKSYLKFELRNITGEIVSAKLRLFVLQGGDRGGTFYLTSNNFLDNQKPWDEHNLNWTNAPEMTGLPLSVEDFVQTGTYVEIDVMPIILAEGNYSFGIKGGPDAKIAYASKESSNPPELVIHTTISGNPSSLTKRFDDTKLNKLQNVSEVLPQKFELKSNYPNPFNLETMIEYSLPEESKVRLFIYNLRGQLIRKLVDEIQSAGNKKIVWTGRDDFGLEVASSVYFIRLQAGKKEFVKKIVLQK